MRERLRRAPSAFERDHRKVRALRILFARLPHLRDVGAGNGFAAGPHLPHETGERWRRGNEFEMGEPLRQLPRLHGLHDRMPFRGGLRKTYRGDARADRTKYGTLPGRKAPPAIHVRNFYTAGSFAVDALAVACLPEIWIAGRGPKLEPREAVAEVTPAVGAKRRRVGLLLGCVQREFFSQVNAATVRVLAAEGCEVVAPQAQPCCGALLVHAGEEAAAVELAKRMIDAFERANVETVVTNAAGCGSNVKEYGHLLRDEPEYAERAIAFAAKCKDVSELLAELEPRAKRNALKLRVAFHDSCHLQHAQGVRSQPRSLLSKIPGLELAEIPEAAICCGSAGIFNLVQPNAANALGDRKAELIAPLKADVVATGNPGCILQMQSALARNGQKIPVVHTIQLLDASIRGESIESLRR